MRVVSKTKYSLQKYNFLNALSQDLKKIGLDFRIKKNDSILHTILLYDPSITISKSTELKLIRDTQVKKSLPFIKKMEKEGISSLFIDGSQISLQQIKPKVEICKTRKQINIYRYCKYFQSIPSTNRVGREIKALVYDIGQKKKVLIGVFCLASSMYNLGCRDIYLNWTGSTKKQIKNLGLKNIMDLSVCVSIPPYSYLLAGKLICMLAFSKTVVETFHEKYNNHLHAVLTTCASGVHCPMFNRIMIVPGGLYKKIGMTKGFTTTIFSKETFKFAKTLVKNKNMSYGKNFKLRNPLKDIRAALNCCEIVENNILKLGNPKAVYLGSISQNNLNYLRKPKPIDSQNYFTTKVISDYWRNYYLSKRTKNRTSTEKVSSFNKSALILSQIS